MRITTSVAGQAIPHESAREHVTGEALYTDDLLLRFPHPLHAWPVLSPHAHALVKALEGQVTNCMKLTRKAALI